MIIYRKLTGREQLRADGCIKHNRIKAFHTSAGNMCVACLESEYPAEYAHFTKLEEKNHVSEYVQAQENAYYDNQYSKIK
jgi:Ni,Fe-hydrogenase I small subunit